MSKGGSSSGGSSKAKKTSNTITTVGTGAEPRYPVGISVDPLPVNQNEVLANQLAAGYSAGGGAGNFQAALEGMYRPTQYTQLYEPLTQTARSLGLTWTGPGTYAVADKKKGFNPNKFDIPMDPTYSSFINALLANKLNQGGKNGGSGGEKGVFDSEEGLAALRNAMRVPLAPR